MSDNIHFKIIIVGDIFTGKTNILNCYIYKSFTNSYKLRNGVTYDLKKIELDYSEINLSIYDISGIEKFGDMTELYYKSASCAFIVVDVNNEKSLLNALEWKKDIDSKVRFPGTENLIPIILLVNKIDEYKDKYCGKTFEEMDIFCKQNGFEEWIDVSAKKNINIDLAFNNLVQSALNYKKEIDEIELLATFSFLDKFSNPFEKFNTFLLT